MIAIASLSRVQIYPETTLMRAEQLNEIYEKIDKSNDSGTRYVLDIHGSLTDEISLTEACKNIPPPGWEGFNPIYGYGSVSLPDPVFSGWVLKEREQEKCGTVYQVKEQYVFEIVRA